MLERWQKKLVEAVGQKEADRLEIINDFFNNNFQFVDDLAVWHQSDYWATPIELIGQGRGDCEDVAIAKYYSLIVAGVAVEKLRLVYVKASTGGSKAKSVQAHMVLAYFPTPTSVPLVLDNLDIEIKSAALRSDLQPIFSFNSAAVWLGVAAATSPRDSNVEHLTRWQDLQRRVRSQGVDEQELRAGYGDELTNFHTQLYSVTR